MAEIPSEDQVVTNIASLRLSPWTRVLLLRTVAPRGGSYDH